MGRDILKIGYASANLANICLHKSTSAIIHPFSDNKKNFQENILESFVDGALIVFTR